MRKFGGGTRTLVDWLLSSFERSLHIKTTGLPFILLGTSDKPRLVGLTGKIASQHLELRSQIFFGARFLSQSSRLQRDPPATLKRFPPKPDPRWPAPSALSNQIFQYCRI